MLGLLTVLLGGCGAPVSPEMPHAPPPPLLVFSEASVSEADVDLAIIVALELLEAPEQHVTVLNAHGLTSERWETMLVSIASDPQASKRYAAEIEGAAGAAPAPSLDPE